MRKKAPFPLSTCSLEPQGAWPGHVLCEGKQDPHVPRVGLSGRAGLQGSSPGFRALLACRFFPEGLERGESSVRFAALTSDSTWPLPWLLRSHIYCSFPCPRACSQPEAGTFHVTIKRLIFNGISIKEILSKKAS